MKAIADQILESSGRKSENPNQTEDVVTKDAVTKDAVTKDAK
jgi:hypothetical protein